MLPRTLAKTLGSAALLFTAALTPACAADATNDATEPEGSSEEAVVGSAKISSWDVEAVIAKLRAQRSSAPLGAFYENGSRLEGCWRNPAGKKLTDLKKSVYCSMPLELRLCNTLVLLTVDERAVEERFRGYQGCKKKVDAVFGGRGLFAYGADVDAVYREIYLEGATLGAADTKRIVAQNAPAISNRSFPAVLGSIVASLAREAATLHADALDSMVRDVQRATGQDPR